MSRGKNKRSELHGMNSHVRLYDDNTKLDGTEAEAIFSEWYNKRENYNYNEEPENNDAGKSIVRHSTLTIIFLVLLVNCHIKHANKSIIYI